MDHLEVDPKQLLRWRGDNSEQDKGTTLKTRTEMKTKHQRVSPYVLIHGVASIMISETRSDQRREMYYGFFTNQSDEE